MQQLLNIGIIQHGEFTLKSGQTSNIYCDMRKIVSYPHILDKINDKLWNLLSPNVWNQSIIAGVPTGAIPFSIGISIKHQIPAILIRKDKKEYGMKSIIDGNINSKKVILIEDVITTGTSVIEIIDKLKDKGITVSAVLSVIDRGGSNNIKKLGYSVYSLWSIDELLETPEKPMINDIINLSIKKNSNVIVSVDLKSSNNVLDFIELIGKHVLGIKIHSDLYPPSELKQFHSQIKTLKKKYSLIIIEDRKLSDIPSIACRQAEIISDWADIITAYATTGIKMLEEINKIGIGILPIYSLSTSNSNNLLTDEYRNNIKKSEKFSNVIGFITQEHVVDGLLNFTPGVHLQADKIGSQCYSSPDILIDRGMHIFIVGRGIYQNPDSVKACKEYSRKIKL